MSLILSIYRADVDVVRYTFAIACQNFQALHILDFTSLSSRQIFISTVRFQRRDF